MSRRSLLLAAALLLGACGDEEGATTTTTSAPTPSTTVAGTALDRLPDVFATPLDGYEMVELPAAIIQEAERIFATATQEKARVVAVDGRSVLAGSEPVAVVIAVGYDAADADLDAVADGFREGAAAGAVTTEELTLAGEEAVLTTNAEGVNTVVWSQGRLGLVVSANGADEETLTDIAEQLIAANA